MHFLDSFKDLRLDVVGIIAILGEGVSALSWYNVIPRLLPAPQALLEHERKRRLPTQAGIVVGAYSGNVRHQLNFFAQLLHSRHMDDYEVELVEVTKNKTLRPERSYGPKEYSWLFALALLGFAMSVALVVLAVIWHDGFALLSVVLLSMVSTLVGIGTHWTLVFREPKMSRAEGVLPRSDVVIYYPHGAIRVVRCEEAISRLYFQTESCDYSLADTPYRTLASLATMMLMAAVISLANATNRLQVAFVAAYVVLNLLYWICSALNPCTKHWINSYQVNIRDFRQQPTRKRREAQIASHIGGTPNPSSKHSVPNSAAIASTASTKAASIWQRMQESWRFRRILMSHDYRQAYIKTSGRVQAADRNFTRALWAAIALTGTTTFLNEATHIAPISNAWAKWIREAGEQVKAEPGEEDVNVVHDLYEPSHIRRLTTRRTALTQVQRRILLPAWDFQGRLTEILQEQPEETRKAPVIEEQPAATGRPLRDLEAAKAMPHAQARTEQRSQT